LIEKFKVEKLKNQFLIDKFEQDWINGIIFKSSFRDFLEFYFDEDNTI
jgi:hypothetical protein